MLSLQKETNLWKSEKTPDAPLCNKLIVSSSLCAIVLLGLANVTCFGVVLCGE